MREGRCDATVHHENHYTFASCHSNKYRLLLPQQTRRNHCEAMRPRTFLIFLKNGSATKVSNNRFFCFCDGVAKMPHLS